MPAAASCASAAGASGTRYAASGWCALALSIIGLTDFSGCERAEEPITATTRSNSGALSEDVERALHRLVVRARDGEIDDARLGDLDAGGGEPRIGVGARLARW